MSTAKYIGRVGALAVALGVGNVRRAATRMTVSIGTAVLVVMATVVPAPTVSPAVRLSASSAPCTRTDVTCGLIMGTSGVPTPDDFYVESAKNRFIVPTHPGQNIEYVKVTTPEGLWPSAVPGRLLSLLGFGSPEIFGPGGPAWDVPWSNLLFEPTLDQSVLQGVTDLERAMAAHGNDDLVIYGYSQSALIANREKRKLAEQYPAGTEAPDIDFVLGGDENLPNGGIHARFPGLYIPILNWTFNGPAPTDTQFDTVEITHQYDFMADFPLYPLNLFADVNAALGFLYVHLYPFDVSLPADPTKSPAYQGKHGDTSYYFFENPDLPLFGPLRMLGVPESLIDVVEPFFKVIVDLGYDRSIPPWEPTPARLIPPLNPGKVTVDLVNAIGEGINNALAIVGLPPLLSIPAPVTADQEAAVDQLAPGPESIVETVGRDAGERVSPLLTGVGSPPPQPPAVSKGDPIDEGIETVKQSGPALDTTLNRVRRDVGDGVSRVLPAVGSQLPKPPAVTHDDLEGSQRTVSRKLAATRDQINHTTGEVNSVVGNGRSLMRSTGERVSTETTAKPERNTSVRDPATKSGSDVNKTVTPVSRSLKQALSGGQDDGDSDNNREDEAE